MGTRLVLLLSLAIGAGAHASDPDEFPVEGTPTVEVPEAAAPEAPVAAEPSVAEEPADAVEATAEAPPPAVPEEALPDAAAEPAPKKGPGPWVEQAASDVGAAFSSAWRGITGKGKDGGDDTAEAPAQAIDDQGALAVPVSAPPDVVEPAEPEVRVEHEVRVEREVVVRTEPAVAPECEPCGEASEHEARARRWRFHQHTLFGVKRRSGRFGPYVGGTWLLSEYGSGRAGAWGLEGGVVLGSHFVLGVAGYATGPFESSDHDVVFAYAGFQPGLVLWSGALVHPRFDVLLGTAAVIDTDSGGLLGLAPVAVPRVGAELNVSRALRLSGNLGWRFVGAPGEAQDAFSGLEAGVTLRFGWM